MRGQRDVGGYDDVGLAGALRDPVVGGIGADQQSLGQAHIGVRHEMDLQPMPLRHPHRLSFTVQASASM